MYGSEIDSPTPEEFVNTLKLFCKTYDIVLRRDNDPSVFILFLYVTLVFVYHLTFYPEAIRYVA